MFSKFLKNIFRK